MLPMNKLMIPFFSFLSGDIAPVACCLAANADCLACTKGVTVEKYCEENSWVFGCPGKLLNKLENYLTS